MKDDLSEIAGSTAHADVMVMLMGGIADRVLEVADLYHEGVAGKVWIVQEGMGTMEMLNNRGVSIITTTEQVRGALADLGIPADSIEVLPGGAISTQMEAIIVRDYLSAGQEIDTLLLVSSASHMLRAHKIFRAALATREASIEILCSPSRYTEFNAEKWWKSREDIQDVVLEYIKIMNFQLFEKRDLKQKPRI